MKINYYNSDEFKEYQRKLAQMKKEQAAKMVNPSPVKFGKDSIKAEDLEINVPIEIKLPNQGNTVTNVEDTPAKKSESKSLF